MRDPSKPVPQSKEEPAWYCLRSKTKCEHLAAAQLFSLSQVEVFCPRLRFRRNLKRGRVWFTEALFPGYFFAKFSARHQYRQVIHSPGVSGMVSFGNTFIAVPDEDISVLREFMDENDIRVIEDSLEEGNEIEVVTGPFRGIQVVVTKVLPTKDRVRILMEFLGGWREIEVETGQLATRKPMPHGLIK